MEVEQYGTPQVDWGVKLTPPLSIRNIY
jgi:hypothetical protein